MCIQHFYSDYDVCGSICSTYFIIKAVALITFLKCLLFCQFLNYPLRVGTFMHSTDTFIRRNLYCIEVVHFHQFFSIFCHCFSLLYMIGTNPWHIFRLQPPIWVWAKWLTFQIFFFYEWCFLLCILQKEIITRTFQYGASDHLNQYSCCTPQMHWMA